MINQMCKILIKNSPEKVNKTKIIKEAANSVVNMDPKLIE